MRFILIALILASPARQLADQSEALDWREVLVAEAFTAKYGIDPTNPPDTYELDISEQCNALMSHNPTESITNACKGL